MKNTLIALMALALSSSALMAQDVDVPAEKWNTPYPVQRVEGEISVGFSFPADSYHNAEANASLDFGLALRYNFPNSPFDCGLQLGLTTVQRSDLDYYKPSEYRNHQTNRIVSVAVTGAYNFRQGHKVNPFAGIGVGVGFMDVVGDRLYPVNGANIVFIPKIGCEFWGVLRVYASSHIIRRGFNSLDVGIGVALGGWRKK